MKKKITALLISIVALFSLVFVSQNLTTSTAKAASNPDPIFFIPGAYSNVDSWDPMYEQLDPAHQHPVVKMFVDSNGTITRTNVRNGVSGERPFVTVTFQNILWNPEAAFDGAQGLSVAIQSYRSTYPFRHADIIAQSNGGNIATRYLEDSPSSTFQNLITVGTPFNMRADNGAPATDWLIGLARDSHNLNPNMKVINTIGNMGPGTTSDNVVSRDSSLAGNLVFPGHVASFRQIYITGEDAIHSNQVSAPSFAKIISSNIDL